MADLILYAINNPTVLGDEVGLEYLPARWFIRRAPLREGKDKNKKKAKKT